MQDTTIVCYNYMPSSGEIADRVAGRDPGPRSIFRVRGIPEAPTLKTVPTVGHGRVEEGRVPGLAIRLLGSPEIECDGRPVRLERRKAMALLAYVALSAKPCERKALGEMLWPDVRPGGASAYLRHTLWLIHQTPIARWLEMPGNQAFLRRGSDCSVDVLAFREHVREARTAPDGPGAQPWPGAVRLAHAVRLYHGDFMAGFLLRGSADFEDWQLRQEEALRRDLAESLARLVSYHEARHEMRQALHYARRWLELDPLDEQAQGRLILLQARAGHRAAALRLFARSERLLRDELGVVPGARMLRLRERIVAGDFGDAGVPQAPPRREGPQRPPALPHALAPFVGREEELAEIGRVLSCDACRFLALIGPGGTGKTRLALQAGHSLGPSFADGAVFVPLANVMSAEQVLPAVLAALRISTSTPGALSGARGERTGRAERERLLDSLRERRMLVILDNVEHVLEGLDWLEALGAAAPRMRVILTSRVRPGIGSAWVLEVGGLACPQPAAPAEAERACDAVQLFLEHARRARIGFAPDSGELAAIGEICRLLDGLPLGIELAAAWSRSLSCRELAEEIRRGVDFLKDSPARVAERHRGLRAVFTQSWAHLSPDEQRHFRRLALFRGGFTRRAAEEVAGASAQILSGLIDKSLLRRMPTGRYELLEVVRQYAAEHLNEVPEEWAAIRARHGSFFLSELAARRGDLQGERVAQALAAATADADNLREAWAAALDPPRLDLLVPVLIPYFLVHDISSRWPEGGQRFAEASRALAHAGSEQARLARGFSLVAEGWFVRQNDWRQAMSLMGSGTAILASLPPSPESTCARTLVAIETLEVDRARAEEELRRLAEQQEHLRDRWGLALTLEVLSTAVLAPAKREDYALSGLALREEIGDRWGIALALHVAGLAAGARRDHGQARERFTRSLAIRRELDTDPIGIASCLLHLGRTALGEGDVREAERWFAECRELSREHASGYQLLLAEQGLGEAAFQAERLGDAREHFEKALSLMAPFAGKCSVAEAHGILANIDLEAARPADARTRLAAGRAIDPAHPWLGLAAARLALAEGSRDEAHAFLRQTLAQISGGGHDATCTTECLLEAAERLISGAAAVAFVVCGFLLRRNTLSPTRRMRISRLLRRAARRVPRAQRPAALAEGREIDLAGLVARVLAVAPFANLPAAADRLER